MDTTTRRKAGCPTEEAKSRRPRRRLRVPQRRFGIRQSASCAAAGRPATSLVPSGKWTKDTGGQKMEDPDTLKPNELAQFYVQPQQSDEADDGMNVEELGEEAW